MRTFFLLISLLLLSTISGRAQQVILYEDFEGALPGWYNSTTAFVDNQWALLNNTNSALTYGSKCIAVSNDGVNNTYVGSVSSDHSIWITPAWPNDIASQE